MESKVTRFSQRSPVTLIIGYSFLLPVHGIATVWTMSGPEATIGLRPSIRAIRTKRTTCTSVQATSAGTLASGVTAGLSVLSQNNN